jgi:hypothetical protein
MLEITYLLRVAEAVGSCDDPELVDETAATGELFMCLIFLVSLSWTC